MQSTNIPTKIPLPFAYSAGSSYKRSIPTASQIGITAGAASLTDGFPPVTFLPIGSGGTPPFGQDTNGILYEITSIQQWQEAGGFFLYDSAFSTTIGGYPKGAILQSTSFNGLWTSTVENNTANPDTGGAGWQATAFAGIQTISTTGGTTTLTQLQSAYPIILITGALTSNAIIVMPNIVGNWTVSNNTTGAYTVTVKTAAGTGFLVSQGSNPIYGDGTNIYSGVSAETTRATAAEAAETTRATAAEAAIQSNVSAETTRATSAETTIQNAALGHGQSWQIVTGSRSLGTTFYNTGTNPITVSITFNPVGGVGSGNGGIWYINGVSTGIHATTVTGYSGEQSSLIIVPAGAAYSNQGALSFDSWVELR